MHGAAKANPAFAAAGAGAGGHGGRRGHEADAGARREQTAARSGSVTTGPNGLGGGLRRSRRVDPIDPEAPISTTKADRVATRPRRQTIGAAARSPAWTRR